MPQQLKSSTHPRTGFCSQSLLMRHGLNTAFDEPAIKWACPGTCIKQHSANCQTAQLRKAFNCMQTLKSRTVPQQLDLFLVHEPRQESLLKLRWQPLRLHKTQSLWLCGRPDILPVHGDDCVCQVLCSKQQTPSATSSRHIMCLDNQLMQCIQLLQAHLCH